MLEIDYSLIPLSAEDRKAVDTDVAAQLNAGVAPKIEKSHFGRVVVLNPDPVQTTHQVPDDLRAHLRRIMQHTTEGQVELQPEMLLRELQQPEEPLHVLIIEFKTKFTHMAAFLDCIPQLRQRYPDLGVFLHTSQATALERLPELMGQKDWMLQLSYPDARGTIEITDPTELSQVASSAPEPVAFSTPFFSQIRLKLPEGKEPVVYNLDTLRTLSSRFGVGKAREVEIGGRKEKVVVVDLPASMIRDFQFRQNRGIDFQGVVMDGRKILSRDFSKRKLEFRWVGLRSLDGFIHQMPGQEATTVQVSSIAVMRVNTFNGEVRMIARSATDQISLQDVGMLGFRKLPGKNGAGGPAPGEGRIADAGGLNFDRLILAENEFNETDPVQQAVRLHFYGRRLRGDMERRRKLEIYTSRINVGAVGPLAGQTLKILRRHGLEKLIDAQSFHYLCDLPQQLPQYFNTPTRFEAHFANLVKSLAALMTADGADEMRLRDCTLHMPITHEWIDTREVLFEQVNSQQLETVYRELQVLKGFIGQEFRRNFEIGQEELAFFNKIHAVEAAALQAKWMADYKRKAYGPPLPQDDLPDFVFFGRPADKAENDASFFFPSFACTELVTSEQTAKLFSRVDYEFSVFLEEQMALAEHHYREQAQTGIGSLEYGVYFDEKADETRKELDQLKADLISLDSTDSPEYQALLGEEEAAFRERHQKFMDDREQVQSAQQAASANFLQLVDALASELKLPARPSEAPGEGESGETAQFDLEVTEAANRELQNKMILLHEQLGGVLKGVVTGVTELESTVSGLEHTMQIQRQQVKSHALVKQAAQQAQVHAKAGERRATLIKLEQGELGGLARRVQVQLAQYSEERQKLGERTAQHEERTQKILHAMHDTLSKTLAGLQELEQKIQPAKPRVKRANIANHLAGTERVFTSLRAMAERLKQGNMQSESYQVRGQKLATHLYTLRVESALIQSIADKTEPDLPTPAVAPAQPGTAGETHAAFSAYQRRLDAFEGGLEAATAGLKDVLAEADGHLLEFEKSYARIAELEKLASHKERLRLARISLDERRRLMEAELEDLPRRVRERFMPARKELLLKVFIPDVERRMLNLQRAKAFLEEVFRLDHQLLQHEYLDRAVYRRFSSNQFLRGAYIAVDSQQPSANDLQNVRPAVNRLFRTLHFNYGKQHPDKAERVSSSHLRTMEKNTLLEFVQRWAAEPEKTPYDYIVLPASLELAEAVELMNYKDRAFRGVPRLVLIYVSKFSTSEILEDPALREAYFRAQKHNVVVNIDGHAVVDNPLSICHRLLQESLGSCFDTFSVEELPDHDEQTATFRV